jgi:protein involved in polysaccharide export with SLBB domain
MLAAFAAAAPHAQAQEQRLARLESLQPSIPQYVLGSGDKVRVTVYGEDDLSGEYAVDGNGYISLPLVGDVKAAGLSAPALQMAVANAYGNGYVNEPRVSVEVTTYRPFTIIGQVERPGQYSYVNGMNVVNAVAMAGGYTPQAEENSVYIRHEGDTKESEVDAEADVQVRPGDTVYVRRTAFWSLMSIATPVTAILGAARYGIP